MNFSCSDTWPYIQRKQAKFTNPTLTSNSASYKHLHGRTSNFFRAGHWCILIYFSYVTVTRPVTNSVLVPFPSLISVRREKIAWLTQRTSVYVLVETLKYRQITVQNARPNYTTYKIGQIYWHRKKLWVLVGVLVQTVWAWKYSKGKYIDQKQVNLGFISRVFVKITWWVCLEFFSGDVIFGEFNFCHSCGLKTIWQTKVQKYLLTSIFPQKN